METSTRGEASPLSTSSIAPPRAKFPSLFLVTLEGTTVLVMAEALPLHPHQISIGFIQINALRITQHNPPPLISSKTKIRDPI